MRVEWAVTPHCYSALLRGRRVVFLFRRLSEPLAERPKLLNLVFAELVVALGEVRHRFAEPRDLIFMIGADDATPHYMLKELVTSLFESAWGVGDLRWTGALFSHALGDREMDCG